MFFAIPYFKNATFLKETLQSLVKQTDPNWTAVILDDSIDANESKAARECVESFQDSRITFKRNPENLGMAGNWNQGLEIGTPHDLCVILHADDLLGRHYVERMKALSKKHPKASGFFSRAEIIGENGESVFSVGDTYKRLLIPRQSEIVLEGVSGIEKLIPGNFIFCPSVCYRMTMIQNERFKPHLKMVLDFEFVLRVLKMGGTWVGYDEEAIFQYRRHTENATIAMTQNLVRFKEEVALYQELSGYLSEKGHSRLAKKAERMDVIRFNLAFQILKSLSKLRIKDANRFLSALINLRKINE